MFYNKGFNESPNDGWIEDPRYYEEEELEENKGENNE